MVFSFDVGGQHKRPPLSFLGMSAFIRIVALIFAVRAPTTARADTQKSATVQPPRFE